MTTTHVIMTSYIHSQYDINQFIVLIIDEFFIGTVRELLLSKPSITGTAMNHHLPLCLSLSLVFSSIALADEVVREVPDNTAGRGYGALSGLMVGAVGGPIGAIAGAAAGFWIGHSVQQTAGLSDTAYEIKDAQGELKIVRSPNARFAVGQQVQMEGIRLVAQPE
ncbi:hypothetical protein [Pseudomonas sp. W4I3]|uniref:hypothetical protein n=1 Tax=Pseudomonas sp. W4I3 TaxID=3042294 RepID=UPI002784B579|nr:hypothetical protein [Pseudomonas sp. W4I3]MDQ0740304.1 hypothetical protein [Pseudomonas sp. W4I3]